MPKEASDYFGGRFVAGIFIGSALGVTESLGFAFKQSWGVWDLVVYMIVLAIGFSLLNLATYWQSGLSKESVLAGSVLQSATAVAIVSLFLLHSGKFHF